MNNCMNISIWTITYHHYDEIINQSFNTCIILVRGRSDLFNSGGRWSKGGRDVFKIQEGVGLKGSSKIQGGGGVWTLDEAMVV